MKSETLKCIIANIIMALALALAGIIIGLSCGCFGRKLAQRFIVDR